MRYVNKKTKKYLSVKIIFYIIFRLTASKELRRLYSPFPVLYLQCLTIYHIYLQSLREGYP